MTCDETLINMKANCNITGIEFDATSGRPEKSKAASKVLQLMDKDFSYQQALAKTLREDKRLSKIKLENELNYYI